MLNFHIHDTVTCSHSHPLLLCFKEGRATQMQGCKNGASGRTRTDECRFTKAVQLLLCHGGYVS